MTPEQKIFWNSLKFDAQWFAHEQAGVLKSLSGKRLHNTVDELMIQMVNHLSAPDICSVLKTWLNTYNLPLDATKLGQGFDKVHKKIGPYIMDNAPHIRPLEVN